MIFSGLSRGNLDLGAHHSASVERERLQRLWGQAWRPRQGWFGGIFSKSGGKWHSKNQPRISGRKERDRFETPRQLSRRARKPRFACALLREISPAGKIQPRDGCPPRLARKSWGVLRAP